MDSGIDLCCGQETAQSLDLSGHRLYIIRAMEQFKIGSFSILPFDGIHNIPVLGFLVQNDQGGKATFIIDSTYCKYRFKNLNYVMIGINYDLDILKNNIKNGSIDPSLARRIMQAHMSLNTALNFFKDQDLSKVEIIHVLHVSEKNADKEKMKIAIQKLTGKLVLI